MRDDEDARVQRLQLALEPFEAGDVEVVRRLVEKEQVRVAAERACEGGACQLAAGEGVEQPVEVVVGEAEAAHDGRRPVAPGVPASVLEPGLRLRVAAQRRLGVVARRHRVLEPAELVLDGDQVGCARQHVLAQHQPALKRRALVVQRDARPFLERELAAVHGRLTGEHAKQRRLARAVRSGQRETVAPLHLEGDAVEEDVAGELLPEIRCDHDSHGQRLVVARNEDMTEGRPCGRPSLLQLR